MRAADGPAAALLRNGRVVDGSGHDGRAVDVLVRGDTIVDVGPGLAADGASIVDLDGLVLAPGFIDTHTHFDAQVLWDPDLSPSSWYGVTSVVAGNCGFALAPNNEASRATLVATLETVEGMPREALEAGVRWGFESYGEYLDVVGSIPLRLNFGGFVGHTAIRHAVMGDDATERDATPDELARMGALVSASVREGAFGFSTSKYREMGARGRPVASTGAPLSELKVLATASGVDGPRVLQILVPRDFDLPVLAELGEASGGTVLWGPALSSRWGERGAIGSILDDLETRGGDRIVGATHPMPVVQEVGYRDPTALRLITPAFEEALKLSRNGDERDRLFADPAWLARAEASVIDGMQRRLEAFEIAVCPTEPQLEGRRVADVAAERGTSLLGCMTALSLRDGLRTKFLFPISNDDEAELASLMTDPRTIFSLSDAGAHVTQLCDAGYCLRVLSTWVRERGVLGLGAAVRKLSTRPAEVMGISDRGRIAVGSKADLVAFDLDTVGDGPLERVNDLPTGAPRVVRRPRGIHHVWVNGTAIRHDGVDLDARPGRVLRAGGANR